MHIMPVSTHTGMHIHIFFFNLHYHCPHFISKETKAQRSYVPGSGSYRNN